VAYPGIKIKLNLCSIPDILKLIGPTGKSPSPPFALEVTLNLLFKLLFALIY
jgi:hypothetical protein